MPAKLEVPSDSRTAALTAGAALLVMAVAAALTYGYAHGSLVEPGDAAATWDNITSSPMLWKAEILGWLVILLCDVVAAWGLYVYLKPTHPTLSLLGGWLRLAYAGILGVAILPLVYVLRLSGHASGSVMAGGGPPAAQAMLFLGTFESMWSIGLILFGAHLWIIGVLAYRSELIPRIIGILLLLASIGYMSVHLGHTLFPDGKGWLKGLETGFTVPMAAGELGLAIWLLVRGGRLPRGREA